MYPIDHFWRAVERWPERIAIDSSQSTWRYDRLGAEVQAMSAALIYIDPAPQSRVAICCRNSAEHITALLAVLASGKTWVPLNPKSTAREIQRILDLTKPSIVILDPEHTALVDCLGARHIYTARNSEYSSVATMAELVVDFQNAPRPVLELPSDATQAIKFTGGTTGVPKGVMQPYRAWLSCIVNLIQAWEFDEHERYVVAAPMTHGTSTYLLPILAQGGCHVLMSGTGAKAAHETFRDKGGTVAFMPPTLIYMMMELPGVSRADFPNLRRLIYAGAPMPAEKIRQVSDFFGPVLGTTYGQTEAPQILTFMRPCDFEDSANWSSVGRASWFTDLGIMAPDGRLLPRGELGEVVARGDLVMTGYFGRPETTESVMTSGWLHTGDRGILDERGFLFLKDRLKDMLITGGFNVYPSDVESVISEHPAVLECTVFGVPDGKWGEAVHTAVQLRAHASVDQEELMRFVRDRLGPVHTPKQVHFYRDLPRSPVGKVLKQIVRAEVMQRSGSESA